MMDSNVRFKIMSLYLTFSLAVAYNPRKTIVNVRRLTAASNEFALNLFKQMSLDESRNIFFSPLSIFNVLGMLLYGAKGETKEELRHVLCTQKAGLSDEAVPSTFNHLMTNIFQNNISHGYTLNHATGILLDTSLNLNTVYKNEVERFYNASIVNVDFRNKAKEIKNGINDWINSQTGGKINHLLNEVDSSSRMILLTASHFKGTWNIPFNPKGNIVTSFAAQGKQPRIAEMMFSSESYFFTETEDYQALRLPYDGMETEMLVILPNTAEGLPGIVKSLTPGKLYHLINDLKETRTIVGFPKFKLELTESLTKHLISLGMNSFGTGTMHLSGMTETRDVDQKEAIHKATIEVTNEGTEAAEEAGSGSSNRLKYNPFLIVNKPFVIIIMNRSKGLILFIGQVTNL